MPVLVGGAVMPLAPDLPDDLKALTRRQAIEINHKQWEASTGELIRTLESILKAPAADASLKEVKPQEDVPAGPVITGDGAAPREKKVVQPDDREQESSTGKRWILPLAAAAALLAGIGLWLGQGDRKSTTVPEAPVVAKAVERSLGFHRLPGLLVQSQPVGHDLRRAREQRRHLQRWHRQRRQRLH